MATPGTKIFVYGHLGFEGEIDSHIKTRVVFAIADGKKTRLAWYVYSQLMIKTEQAAYDVADIEGGMGIKIFGVAGPTHQIPESYDFKFEVDNLAPPIKGAAAGTSATLDLHDDDAGSTSCLIYIDVKPNGRILQFDLKTNTKRRTLDKNNVESCFFWGSSGSVCTPSREARNTLPASTSSILYIQLI